MTNILCCPPSPTSFLLISAQVLRPFSLYCCRRLTADVGTMSGNAIQAVRQFAKPGAGTKVSATKEIAIGLTLGLAAGFSFKVPLASTTYQRALHFSVVSPRCWISTRQLRPPDLEPPYLIPFDLVCSPTMSTLTANSIFSDMLRVTCLAVLAPE